jgi:hypothetical protein
MPSRQYRNGTVGYRFGYNNGSEKDDEISGEGNHITTLYREGDTRLGLWWGVDPKEADQPWQSTYNFMDCNPILRNDPNGDVAPAFAAAIPYIMSAATAIY